MKMNEKVNEEDTSNNEDDSAEGNDSEETDSKVEDKSSAKGSSKDEASDDDEDITKQYFTDPESLDPKLRGAFKKMQGMFTKRMQEATTGIKKAQAFDQLVLDPEFRAWMEERHNKVSGKASSRKSSNDDSEDDDTEDDDTPITRKGLQKELQKVFKGIKEEGSQKEQEVQMKQEAATFKKNNPDWEIYKDEILTIIERHPTLSYQDAYDLASKEDAKKSDTKKTMEYKKKANINKPNRVVGKTVEKKGKMSVTDAFNAAKKSLGL
jgi:hypothetical protein